MKPNSRGFIAIDFLISLTIAATFCVVLFALCFTFTVVEIGQYAAFSAGRAQLAGDFDPATQGKAARQKFSQFVSSNKVIGGLFQNGWFELKIEDIRQGGTDGRIFSDYPTDSPQTVQVGVRLLFNAKLLSLNFSLLGSTEKDGNGFLARITGLLIREPSTRECKEFFRPDKRFRGILDLDPRFNSLPVLTDKYVAMEDNGC